jgi:hypothetical protein
MEWKGTSIRDDPKLPKDSGEVPKLNGVVGGSIPSCEIISLLDEKLAKCSNTMSGKNRRLVTDEPVEVEDFRRITDHFREIYGIYLK